MKVLIIGFGSIGKRHYEVLSEFPTIKQIHIVSKQSLENQTSFTKLEEIEDLTIYDYIVVASETFKHFDQLKYIESKVFGKTILCEKPLFDTSKNLKIVHNIVFIGYVLRFNPLLQKVKTLLENENVISVNVSCGQYLPNWRQGTDYRKCYSAKKSEGGGVLLDLSHEIDYIQWLFGPMKDIKSYQSKVSDLDIDSDDLVLVISKLDSTGLLSLSIDYISKITTRKILVHTNSFSLEIDLIDNSYFLKYVDGTEKREQFGPLERNEMFKSMHQSVLSTKEHACTYEEGLKTMKTISTIQEQNI